MSSLRYKVLLEFQDVFPGLNPESIDQYLSGIGKDMLIQTATYLLGFKSRGSKFEIIGS